jgi:hypothetical protein
MCGGLCLAGVHGGWGLRREDVRDRPGGRRGADRGGAEAVQGAEEGAGGVEKEGGGSSSLCIVYGRRACGLDRSVMPVYCIMAVMSVICIGLSCLCNVDGRRACGLDRSVMPVYCLWPSCLWMG